jgi:ABC-type branched-subunit amino acid transport system substrate-binding protein
MGSQGVPMAVDEINKAGGFKVGDKTHRSNSSPSILVATRRKRQSN